MSMGMFLSVYLHNCYRGLRKKEPLTPGGWSGITTGCCSSPAGCKGCHGTPASHRVTLRAGAKETANTRHSAPQHTPPPLAEKQDCSFLPTTSSASLCSPLSIDEVLRARRQCCLPFSQLPIQSSPISLELPLNTLTKLQAQNLSFCTFLCNVHSSPSGSITISLFLRSVPGGEGWRHRCWEPA